MQIDRVHFFNILAVSLLLSTDLFINGNATLISWPFILIATTISVFLFGTLILSKKLLNLNWYYTFLIIIIASFIYPIFTKFYGLALSLIQIKTIALICTAVFIILISVFQRKIIGFLGIKKTSILTLSFVLTAFGTSLAIFAMNSADENLVVEKIKHKSNRIERANIYHIILDEHLGFSSFPKDMDLAKDIRREIEEFYQKNGFSIYPNAHSNYFRSHKSISSIINLNTYDKTYISKEEDKYQLKKGKLFSALKKKGYEIAIYHNDYMNFCYDSDFSCHEFPLYNLPKIKRPGLKTKQYYNFLFTQLMMNILPTSHFDEKLRYLPAQNSLLLMDTLIENIGYYKNNTYTLAHVLLPHGPSSLDRQCRFHFGKILPAHVNYEESMVKYLNQVACVQTKIEQLINALKKEGLFEKSVIMIHSDHGSRIGLPWPWPKTWDDTNKKDETFLAFYSSLLVAKQPGVAQNNKQPQSVTNFLREFLGLQPLEALEFVYNDYDPDQKPQKMQGLN